MINILFPLYFNIYFWGKIKVLRICYIFQVINKRDVEYKDVDGRVRAATEK